jgi:hypothetical protein
MKIEIMMNQIIFFFCQTYVYYSCKIIKEALLSKVQQVERGFTI